MQVLEVLPSDAPQLVLGSFPLQMLLALKFKGQRDESQSL